MLWSTPDMNKLNGTGVYLVQMSVPVPFMMNLSSGREILLHPGVYCYVGSAQRGLGPRVARHAKKNKPLRWHIDYLTCQYPANYCWLWYDARKNFECEIARTLARKLELVPGFGSSDCRCPGHLFRGSQADIANAVKPLKPDMSFALSEDIPYE